MAKAKGISICVFLFLLFAFNVQAKEIKGVYLTSWSASSNSRVSYVLNLAKSSGVNAVVIDIKDFSGYVSYDTDDAIAPKVGEYSAKWIKIKDVKGLIKKFHDNGIYTIARIAVFQDPVLASARPDLAVFNKYASIWEYLLASVSLWLDNKSLAWIDPASEEAWDYNISIAKDALSKGFDEINFDYVRFPSDGKLSSMGFPKWDGVTPKNQVIRKFFKKTREAMPDAVLSVDLFGLSTVNSDDLGIGQVIEDAYEYFDYVCPMVYPSHYADGFIGYENPAEYPYQVVKYSMDKGLKKLEAFNLKREEYQGDIKKSSALRPWLQDFDLGANYDEGMVKSEIQAVKDSLKGKYNGYMLWNPSNIYTSTAIF